MSRLTRDGTAEPVSRDQILRHARGQGNIIFPGSADHEQDWQPYPVDQYSAIRDDHTYIYTYYVRMHSHHLHHTVANPLLLTSKYYSASGQLNKENCVSCALCLKKNQNAPRPSENPPVRGQKMSKRLGGIEGCKYKTSSHGI